MSRSPTVAGGCTGTSSAALAKVISAAPALVTRCAGRHVLTWSGTARRALTSSTRVLFNECQYATVYGRAGRVALHHLDRSRRLWPGAQAPRRYANGRFRVGGLDLGISGEHSMYGVLIAAALRLHVTLGARMDLGAHRASRRGFALLAVAGTHLRCGWSACTQFAPTSWRSIMGLEGLGTTGTPGCYTCYTWPHG